MDNILGGGQQQQTRTSKNRGIGGLLEGLAGGGQQQQTQQSSGGGLNDILGQLGGRGGAGVLAVCWAAWSSRCKQVNKPTKAALATS